MMAVVCGLLPTLFPQATIVSPKQHNSYEQSCILSDDSAQCHTLYLHAQNVNEEERHDDVTYVLQYADLHGDDRVLHADKPAC